MKTFTQKLAVTIRLLLAAIPVAQMCSAQPTNSSIDQRFYTQQAPTASVMNINDFVMWTRYDGFAGRNPWSGELTKYPRSTANILYQEGLIWGGYVNETGTTELRVGGYNYYVGTVPGAIIAPGVAEDSTDPAIRVYRIRKDYASADLRLDAADLLSKPLNEITDEDVEQVRAQYQKDWEEWPTQKGAPFYDRNGNGVRDNGEAPGLQDADLVLWFVINDLDATRTRAFYGSSPIGLETQVTWWGYKPTSQLLRNSIFMRYRFVYKGTVQSTASSTIQEMYLSKWVDPDLGYFADDLVGCDTTLSLGFVYNSSQVDNEYFKFQMVPPAVGYVLLQGPIVPASAEEVGIFNFEEKRGVKNLPMTSFIGKYTGTPYGDPPYGIHGTNRMYNWIRGYLPLDDVITPRWYIDHTNTPTRFAFSGDPVTGTGWVDGLPFITPGDRRFLVNTGPFSMTRGDTQEVVLALVGGPGADNSGNVDIVKYFVRLLRFSYPDLASLVTAIPDRAEETPRPRDFRLAQNYPNPFNPSTTIEYAIPLEAEVRLTIYDVSGREVRVLEESRKPAGVYGALWDGRDSSGRAVPSGVYLYKLQANRIELTRKLILVR